MSKKLLDFINQMDFESAEDCKVLINKIRNHIAVLGSDDPSFISKNERCRRILHSCQKIMATDISSIYNGIELDTEKKYYVYAHLDTSKRVAIGKESKTTFAATLGMEYFPFYIGEGCGTRSHDLNRNETHRKVKQRLQTFGQEVQIKILFSDLTKLESLCIESKLIDIFGLKPNGGLLCNLDEGFAYKERREIYKDSLHEISRLYKHSV